MRMSANKKEKEKGVRNLFLPRFPPNLAAWRATHAEEKVPDPFFRFFRAGKVLGGLIAGMMVLLAASFVVVVAVIPRPEKVEPPPNIPAVNVSVLHIEPIRNFKDAFTIPGSIEPNSVVRVSAEVPGRIEQITGLEGRAVKAGDKLAELNTDLLKASLDQARASMHGSLSGSRICRTAAWPRAWSTTRPAPRPTRRRPCSTPPGPSSTAR